MSTDQSWVEWGERDPYFAVITDPRFRRSSLSEADREYFFKSGSRHVEYVLAGCRRWVDPAFRPKRILDFGCGVGRVTLPFAQLEGVERVVGVDVSPAMLEEARRNGGQLSLTNVEFAISDNDLTAVTGAFDLIHSFIVFQHIDTERGRRIFARLLDFLEPGGVGVVHFLFGKTYCAESFGQPKGVAKIQEWVEPAMPRGARGLLLRLYRWWRRVGLAATPQTNTAAVKPSHVDPEMQMNVQNLSEILFLIQSVGAKSLHVDFTNHGGELGAVLFFKRAA